MLVPFIRSNMNYHLKLTLLCLTVLLNCFVNISASKFIDSNGACNLPPKLLDEISAHQPIVTDILNQIVNGKYAGNTYNSLEYFCDQFGPRMSGTKNLENAIDYLIETFTKVGLENAHTENAPVPRWERGSETAQLISPHKQNFLILGLGGSVSTPRFGIVSGAVVVESFDEFANISDKDIRGKIAIFVPKWQSYGQTNIYRRKAAAVAAKRGAVAALVRSITPYSIGSPHTGQQDYEDGVKKIPVAALTVEAAEMLLRLYRRGEKIIIRLKMDNKQYKPSMSRNAIGELQGTNKNVNESVVVLSGHIDSWDVGVGAMDDGGGSFISWKALEYLKKMNYRPKRTLRAIMWTGEEQGIWGSKAYAEDHQANEDKEFNFFLESDGGVFNPTGLGYTGSADGACIMQEILKLMAPINATNFVTPSGGPDINVWLNRGFPGGSLLNENDKYFWFHHTYGDSMLVQNSTSMDKATALFAAATYVIANLSVDMPRNV